MKNHKLLTVLMIVLSIIVSIYIYRKITLIDSIKQIQKGGDFRNVPLYKVDSEQNIDINLTFENHQFVIPNFIDYKKEDCSIHSSGIFFCENTKDRYLVILKSADNKQMSDELHALYLATNNTNLTDYSFITPLKELSRIKNLSIIKKSIVTGDPQFLTMGSKNILVTKLKNSINEYIIDVNGSSTILLRANRSVSNEELLSFIRTMQTQTNSVNAFSFISGKTYDVNEAYKLLEKIYKTDDFDGVFSFYYSE